MSEHKFGKLYKRMYDNSTISISLSPHPNNPKWDVARCYDADYANLIAAAPLMNLMLAIISASGYSECSPLLRDISKKVLEVADGKEDMQSVWEGVLAASQREQIL